MACVDKTVDYTSTAINKENIDQSQAVDCKKARIEEIPVGEMQKVNIILKFAKLSKNAITPTHGSKYAAGLDLYSAHKVIIPSRGKAVVKTDIQIAVPSGCYGRVAPRSGLAVKHFIDVGAGVIDQDYRGNVGVVLFNFNDTDYEVNPGDRIAQLILEKIDIPTLEECDKLEETERGDKGYGSTGVSVNQSQTS